MLAVRSQTVEDHRCAAIISKAFTYTRNGQDIFVSVGCEIVVDKRNHRALIGKDTVQLDDGDYTLDLDRDLDLELQG